MHLVNLGLDLLDDGLLLLLLLLLLLDAPGEPLPGAVRWRSIIIIIIIITTTRRTW